MKTFLSKFKILSICALALPLLFQSCNKDNDSAQLYALVTLYTESVTENFIAVLDNGDKIYFSDKGQYTNYKPTSGQRAVVYFSKLDTELPGYKYNAKLYAIDEILTKDIVVLDDIALDTLGNDGILLRAASIGGGYLNVDIAVEHAAGITHYFNLVDNQLATDPVEGNENDDYIVLEFRHKASEKINGLQMAKTNVCFKLKNYDPAPMGDKKGIIVKYTGTDKDERTLKVNLPSTQN